MSAGRLGLTRGRSAHAAGLVIARQRPGTATGVVFLTLEDETGPLNVIVWSSLFERERRIVLGARLMGVTGEVQREGEVVHLIAHELGRMRSNILDDRDWRKLVRTVEQGNASCC